MVLRKGNVVGLLIVLIVICWESSSLAQKQEDRVLIKTAITRSFCYDIYWHGAEFYKRNVPLTLKIKIEDTKFYAKVENIGYLMGELISLYQIGMLKPDRAVVTHNFEMDIKKKFMGESVITDTLILPTDCTPKYDPMTPQKELMIKTILSTIKKQFEHNMKIGIAKYPKELTLIIADFNVDYPETYVIVKETDDIYGVVLHDFSDYDSDAYEREGEYPSAPKFNMPKSLIDKVRKHGIIRKIVLDP